MVKKNITGRGNSTYDESNLAGVQGVFYCSFAVVVVMVVVVCVHLFKMTVACWFIG